MSRRVYRGRRRRPRRKKRWPLVIVAVAVLAGLALAASVVLGYNPLLERQLRAQFGDEFFNHFGVAAPKRGGDDLESIIENYEPSFKELEEKAIERLERLFEKALEDYYRQERAGTLDRFMLTNKYIQAGRILERNVDRVFNSLLEEMEEELTGKGYPTDIAEEIGEAYKLAKNEKKRELLSKLRQKISG